MLGKLYAELSMLVNDSTFINFPERQFSTAKATNKLWLVLKSIKRQENAMQVVSLPEQIQYHIILFWLIRGKKFKLFWNGLTLC